MNGANMSNTFKDNNDRNWTISINIATYLKAKEKLGIDLSNMASENGELANLMTRGDIGAFLDLLTILLEPEFKNGLTPDDLYKAMDAEVVEAATKALLEAIVLFSPAHYRKTMRTAIQAVDQGLEQIEQKLESEMPDLDQLIQTEIDKVSLLPTSTSSSGSQQE